ncbi:MAG TPA: hypothetical protein G4O03_03055 [Dehalococcoidia bacterium]|nr:hypothetical protein [Dehalococcoidia bacterium]
MFEWFRKGACYQARERLSAYLDGQLPSPEQQELAEHLERCEACRAELETLRATVEWLHRLSTVVPPRSFTLREIRPAPRQPVFIGLRVATALAVLLLAAVVVGDWLDAFPQAPPAEQPEARVMAGETPTTATATIVPTPTPGPPARYVTPKPLPPTPEEAQVKGLEPATPPPMPPPTPVPMPGEAEPGPGWPVRQLEYALLGAAVVLAGLSLIYWRRFRLRVGGQ